MIEISDCGLWIADLFRNPKSEIRLLRYFTTKTENKTEMANKNLLKILFVEDLPSDAELAIRELRKEGLQFEHIRVDTQG